jgi:hypothetical protein
MGHMSSMQVDAGANRVTALEAAACRATSFWRKVCAAALSRRRCATIVLGSTCAPHPQMLAPSMTGALAAIYVEDLAGDKARRFQILDGCNDVGDLPQAPDRMKP